MEAAVEKIYIVYRQDGITRLQETDGLMPEIRSPQFVIQTTDRRYYFSENVIDRHDLLNRGLRSIGVFWFWHQLCSSLCDSRGNEISLLREVRFILNVGDIDDYDESEKIAVPIPLTPEDLSAPPLVETVFTLEPMEWRIVDLSRVLAMPGLLKEVKAEVAKGNVTVTGTAPFAKYTDGVVKRTKHNFDTGKNWCRVLDLKSIWMTVELDGTTYYVRDWHKAMLRIPK